MKDECHHRLIWMAWPELNGFHLYSSREMREMKASVWRDSLRSLTWNQSSVLEINLCLNHKHMHVFKVCTLLRAWRCAPQKEAASFFQLGEAIKGRAYLWTFISSSKWVRQSHFVAYGCKEYSAECFVRKSVLWQHANWTIYCIWCYSALSLFVLSAIFQILFVKSVSTSGF